jgi:hypothetical protein
LSLKNFLRGAYESNLKEEADGWRRLNSPDPGRAWKLACRTLEEILTLRIVMFAMADDQFNGAVSYARF